MRSVLFFALAACAACSGSHPRAVGGESHFLDECTETCSGSLQCIDGQCTRECSEDADCADLASDAVCGDRVCEASGGATVDSGSEELGMAGTTGHLSTPDGGFVLPSQGAPSNAYGGPQAIVQHPIQVELVKMCDSGGSHGMSQQDDRCTFLWSCDVECETDADCPGGGSGSAEPACFKGECVLECAGATCPTGMVCVVDNGSGEEICHWPAAAAERGCPGHCMQKDIPPDCPNYCAGQLVECDRNEDRCCDGLICAPWGLCEMGECLQVGWPCTAGEDPACCAGECLDGFCGYREP